MQRVLRSSQQLRDTGRVNHSKSNSLFLLRVRSDLRERQVGSRPRRRRRCHHRHSRRRYQTVVVVEVRHPAHTRARARQDTPLLPRTFARRADTPGANTPYRRDSGGEQKARRRVREVRVVRGPRS